MAVAPQHIPPPPLREPPPPRPPHAHDSDHPRRIANLAAMATNVLRPRDNVHTVSYIAQVDLDGVMVKRLKVGAKTNMYVVLEGTTLTIFKNRSGPPRHVINVRSTPVSVDVARRELHVFVSANGPAKDKLLRLHIPSEEDTYRWKHALESAVNSDITDYYTFGKTLGSGAYGDVVQAFDVRTSEQRAVKIIKRGNNMKSREHLECEIQVMKSISHPNIVQTYQIFDLKRTIYIVMEYVPGGDLFDFVAQHDCLTETQGSQTIRAIFQAVEYLHRHSIVHRDLKPENILCVNKSWPLEIKLTDFGFASFMDPANNSDNMMRTQVGTAYFMAPEIISNKGHGPAVDSWACGVILYTILTGRLPFPGKNTTEYFRNVVKGEPLFPSVLWKGISPDALSLVKGLLNVDPNKRLTSLGALQHRWIASPETYGNEIRRDRSNLHSRRRRLFKARKAIIAVAMANKFKATIPQMVDKVGDGTKKVAEGIGQGVKKTADGIGEGVKKTAEGVKKVGDGIGEGTKKVAEEIGEGTKKVAGGIAGGTKKVAEGIGTGVKKTVDGVEIGAKKVGEGVKKTADGIETGFKKTADGIETGFKKTADGIETGFKKTADGIETGFKKTADGIETGFKKTGEGFKKTGEGFKKTGEGIKRTVEKVKPDKERRGTDGERSNTVGGSHSDSTRDSGRRRPLFRRRAHDSRSSAISGSEPSRQGDIPTPNVAGDVSLASQSPSDLLLDRTRGSDQTFEESTRETNLEAGADSEILGERADESKLSSSEYYSALEEHSVTDEGWETVHVQAEGLDIPRVRTPPDRNRSERTGSMRSTGTASVRAHAGSTAHGNSQDTDAIPDTERGTIGVERSFKLVSHNSSSSANSSRPKLPLLDGLTMGLSDECMAGTSRDALFDPNNSSGGGEPDSLRRTAALLLACERPGSLTNNECTNN